MEFTVEIMPIILYIGVVLPFTGSLLLDRYHFDFLVILKEVITFLSISNPVLQYSKFKYSNLFATG